MIELDFSVIGKRIKEVRSERNLTQEYIANVTGVNVSHISNIETNKVKVSLTLLVGICNALDCTLDYILQNEYQIRPLLPKKNCSTQLKTWKKRSRKHFYGSQKCCDYFFNISVSILTAYFIPKRKPPNSAK